MQQYAENGRSKKSTKQPKQEQICKAYEDVLTYVASIKKRRFENTISFPKYIDADGKVQKLLI